MLRNIIPNKLSKLRKQRGLTQVALAKKLGIFQSEVSDIETGKRIPSIYLAQRIARVFEKDVSEVFPPPF